MDGKSLAALRKSLGYEKLSRIITLSLDQALRDGKLREKKK
jgi:hypothetical protein